MNRKTNRNAVRSAWNFDRSQVWDYGQYQSPAIQSLSLILLSYSTLL